MRPDAIRKAREDAGLSLAQVAAGQLTRGAIHMIEAGRARPSLPTLQLIAQRTRKPLTYFLAENELSAGARPSGDDRIRQVERMFDERKFSEAIASAEGLLEHASDDVDRGQLRLWMAASRLRLRSSIRLALQELKEARRIFEDLGDTWLLVECQGWEAYGLHLEHNPCALEMAEEVLRRCRELDPVPCRTEARILSHLALIHFDHNRLDEGIRCAEEALSASSALADLNTMASVSHNLASGFWLLGQPTKAFDRLRLAISIHQALCDWHMLALAENNLADMLVTQGNLTEAYRHLAEALDLCDNYGLDSARSVVLRTLVCYYRRQGNLENAERAAREALAVSERANQPLFVARCRQYLGEIAAERGQHDDADAHFRGSIGILRGLDAHERLLDCQRSYARILRDRGDVDLAFGQLESAIDSLGSAHIVELPRAAQA